jgi:hypothetical protein
VTREFAGVSSDAPYDVVTAKRLEGTGARVTDSHCYDGRRLCVAPVEVE